MILSKTQSSASEFYLADTVFGINTGSVECQAYLNIKNTIIFDCVTILFLGLT